MIGANIIKYFALPGKYGLLKQELNMMTYQFNTAGRVNVYSHVHFGTLAKNPVKVPSKNSILCTQVRVIHISPPRTAIPPPLLFIIRPIAKLVAIFFGRTFRQWWSTLPPEHKQLVIDKVRKRTFTLFALFGGFIGAVALLYFTHLKEDPITGRWRFIAFSHMQMVKIAEMELIHTVADFRKLILKHNHPDYARVLRVANRILRANINLPGMADRDWTITVVDEPDQINAFVLPNGNIFIFTGMLRACDNDDQLGVILSHEMSHALLEHMAEQLSNVHLVEWLLLIPLVFIWALMPDGAAIFSQWMAGRLATVAFHLPYSRAIEVEADEVGLHLAAKACFDIREASVFWTKMAAFGEEESAFEWLSTHPNHGRRSDSLDRLIPRALRLRSESECPMLPELDPRLLMKILLDKLHSEKALAKTKDK